MSHLFIPLQSTGTHREICEFETAIRQSNATHALYPQQASPPPYHQQQQQRTHLLRPCLKAVYRVPLFPRPGVWLRGKAIACNDSATASCFRRKMSRGEVGTKTRVIARLLKLCNNTYTMTVGIHGYARSLALIYSFLLY